MGTPFFSVVMPVHNGARFIDAAIESVRTQSWHDFELLVTDDASTDDTVSKVAKHALVDRRIHLLRNPGPRGPGRSRNFALAHASAPWVAFLDADDVWPVERLALSARAIAAAPDAVIFFGDYRQFVDRVDLAGPPVQEEKRFFDPAADYVESVLALGDEVQFYLLRSDRLLRFCCLFHCPISTQTVTLKREVLERERIRFREDWQINEDFHVWMRMLQSGPACAVRKVLFFYRRNPGSLTSDSIRYLEGMATSHGEWMRRIWTHLDDTDRRTYQDKVAGFLQSAAWVHSRHGRVLPALSAELRSIPVSARPVSVTRAARTFLRAIWWRFQAIAGRRAGL